MATRSTPDLTSPELYINRELSLLEFNRRVLGQAQDAHLPLLERLRFLTICSTNLDELFEIRVASLKQQLDFDVAKPRADGLSTQQLLADISRIAHEMVAEQYRLLKEELLPALAKEGIRILDPADFTPDQRAWASAYFHDQVLPILTPIGLDPAHPFPQVLNKGLNLIITMTGEDEFGRSSGVAVMQVPKALPRVIPVPRALTSEPYCFVLLRGVIQANLSELFGGMNVTGCYQFRVTRNSELWVDEEEVDDMLKALEGELPGRRFSEAVRLELSDKCPDDVTALLLERFELTPNDLYRVGGPVNLFRLAEIYDLVDRPDLKFPPFVPALPPQLANHATLFDAIRAGDILLHQPYQSFYPVAELVRQAAEDPNVLAIKQTLYRTGANSPMVASLLKAAQAGKEVTVVVELRARFDEAANIDLATRLQGAGANVVYGVVGYKAHAKLLMVVRREESRLRRYIHLGTGNYHARTARAYTDWSLLTCDEAMGQDVHQLFMQLTALGRAGTLRKLVPSPSHLYRTMLQLIEDEITHARAGRPSRIIVKVNNLSDAGIVQALYRASMAGVPIDLIVRSICALRPGIPGISETIKVRSVVGRFLEHTRVYYFLAGGEEKVFCASADWMHRNLHRRVEVCFPILDTELKRRLILEGLTLYLEDNCQAWLMAPDGTFTRATPGEDRPARAAQLRLMERFSS